MMSGTVLMSSMASAGFFVQLKTPATLEKLLAQDDSLKASSHVRPFIQKVFSFGDFEGFSGNFSKLMVRRLIKNDLVKNIVRDTTVNVFGTISQDYREVSDTELTTFQADPWDGFGTQTMAPRHLASLSRQGSLPFNETVNYYYDPKHQGQDVTVYVIDTGVFKDHPEFGGRVLEQKTFVGGDVGDNNGHGTHVAGVVASRTFGVAKKANIVDLKVLDPRGSGSLTNVLAAIEYACKRRAESNTKGIINLSLGSLKNNVLNAAIEAASHSGMVIVAAAGNFASDSCRASPASAEGVISVGAFDDRTDEMASFTNHGPCIDVLASGVDVFSVSHNELEIPAVMSGTSMSAPAISGLAAVLLSQGVEPREIKGKLIEYSRCNRIKNTIHKTPNRAAFNGVNRDDDEYPQSSMYNPSIHGIQAQPVYSKVEGQSQDNMSSDTVFAASEDSDSDRDDIAQEFDAPEGQYLYRREQPAGSSSKLIWV